MTKLLLTAALLGLAAAAPALAEEDAAAKAVEAAKQFSGSTLTVVAEAGLQALLDTQYSGPEWEKLTGIKVKVVELAIRGDLSQDHSRKAGGNRRLRRVADFARMACRHGRQRRRSSRSIPTSRSME